MSASVSVPVSVSASVSVTGEYIHTDGQSSRRISRQRHRQNHTDSEAHKGAQWTDRNTDNAAHVGTGRISVIELYGY